MKTKGFDEAMRSQIRDALWKTPASPRVEWSSACDPASWNCDEKWSEEEIAALRDMEAPPDKYMANEIEPSFMKKRIAELERDRDAALAETSRLFVLLAKSGMSVGESAGDHPYHGPVKDGESIHDVAHERFHHSVGDVLSGKIMPEARRQMQEALKNVPKEPTTIPRLMPKLEKGVRVLWMK
jgi:hypothetical protein